MPYRLIVRRLVLERIDILTISIRPAHAEREEADDSLPRREGRKEEEKKDTDLQDLQDSEASENSGSSSENPANP